MKKSPNTVKVTLDGETKELFEKLGEQLDSFHEKLKEFTKRVEEIEIFLHRHTPRIPNREIINQRANAIKRSMPNNIKF